MRWILALLLSLSICGCLRPDNPPDVVTPDTVPAVEPEPNPSGPFRVLILYENDDFQQLPASQVAAIRSPKLREWLTANKADFRIWDQNVDTKNAAEFWQKAVKLPRDSLPWVWATGGKNGINGPLPASESALIELLEGVKP